MNMCSDTCSSWQDRHGRPTRVVNVAEEQQLGLHSAIDAIRRAKISLSTSTSAPIDNAGLLRADRRASLAGDDLAEIRQCANGRLFPGCRGELARGRQKPLRP